MTRAVPIGSGPTALGSRATGAQLPWSPDTPERDRDSCDEYPYSSTLQGVPQFSVTGHVPRGDNNDAGGRLNEFYQRYHVDNGDEFYVQP